MLYRKKTGMKYINLLKYLLSYDFKFVSNNTKIHRLSCDINGLIGLDCGQALKISLKLPTNMYKYFSK